ncbi:MAG: LysR family transcriptional regulator [Caldimonas sp.]
MDKLRAMQFFCRVVERKSFAAAAQALEVVPSALSKTVAALEQELGFRLINRSTRALSPTDEGATYYERCRQILHDIEDADALGRGGIVRAKGTLRIGMHPALRFALLSQLGAFLDAHPELRVETVITNSPAAVIDDGLDLVLHIGRLPDSGLFSREIGWTCPVVCASPRYLVAHGEPLHPSQLVEHRAIVYARRDEEANTRWVFSKGKESCTVDVPVRMISRDGIGLVDAALGGAGVARPLEISIRPWLGTDQLRPLFQDWTGERLAIAAVMPVHGRRASAKVQAYTEYASAALKPGA